MNAIHTDPVAVARAMYAYEVDKNFDAWFALFDDDVVISFPLEKDADALRVVGKAAWGEITRQKFIDRARTTLDLDVAAFADGRRAFTRLTVSIEFANGTAVRGLPLATVLTINDSGLIVSVDEYENAAPFFPSSEET